MKKINSIKYCICCSKETEKAWNEVINALLKKQVEWTKITVIYEETIDECIVAFKKYLPYQTCFVARPSECNRTYIRKIHQITRKWMPSDGIQTSTIQGILTGPDLETVLKIAREKENLIVKNVIACCPINLPRFSEGNIYSEITENLLITKQSPTHQIENRKCPSDTTSILINHLNNKENQENPVDIMITSGHATEKNWNIGQSFKSGQFICDHNNQLLGENLEKQQQKIDSKTSKVYIASGNCLIANIKDKGCMAQSWMKSASVIQMVGYIKTTWYGYSGWGFNKFFIEMAGQWSFSQSFFANLQTLLCKMEENYTTSIETTQKLAKKSNLPNDCLGLLHDRDNFVFYGDPAWIAILPNPDKSGSKRLPYTTKLEKADTKTWIFSVDTVEQGKWDCNIPDDKDTIPGRPPIRIFENRKKIKKIVKGNIIATSMFVLMPLKGAFGPNEHFEGIFEEEID